MRYWSPPKWSTVTRAEAEPWRLWHRDAVCSGHNLGRMTRKHKYFHILKFSQNSSDQHTASDARSVNGTRKQHFGKLQHNLATGGERGWGHRLFAKLCPLQFPKINKSMYYLTKMRGSARACARCKLFDIPRLLKVHQMSGYLSHLTPHCRYHLIGCLFLLLLLLLSYLKFSLYCPDSIFGPEGKSPMIATDKDRNKYR